MRVVNYETPYLLGEISIVFINNKLYAIFLLSPEENLPEFF